MDIQVASLCDSAADYNGKLCVMGTFDTICARTLPVVHPHCAFAMRICFKPADEGEHRLSVAFIDDDGKPLAPPLEAKVNIRLPDDAYFLTRNIIINLQQLKFDKVGNFSIDVKADDEILCRVPLRVVMLDKVQAQQGGQPMPPPPPTT